MRVRKVAGGVLLEPMISDPAEWLAELKRFGPADIFPKGASSGNLPSAGTLIELSSGYERCIALLNENSPPIETRVLKELRANSQLAVSSVIRV